MDNKINRVSHQSIPVEEYSDQKIDQQIIYLADDFSHIVVPAFQRTTIYDIRSEAVSAARTIMLELAEGAHVVWRSEHTLGPDAKLSTNLSVQLFKYAFFEATWVQKGGIESSLSYKATLEGVGAEARFVGRIRTEGNAVHQVTMVQNHQEAATHSVVDVRALAADASQFLYEGTIVIAEKGKGSTAFQEQKNMVIGKDASVRSVPNIEVLTNDVQCGHGSAISYVQEEQLWYLQSRALSYEYARQMIIDGFLRL